MTTFRLCAFLSTVMPWPSTHRCKSTKFFFFWHFCYTELRLSWLKRRSAKIHTPTSYWCLTTYWATISRKRRSLTLLASHLPQLTLSTKSRQGQASLTHTLWPALPSSTPRTLRFCSNQMSKTSKRTWIAWLIRRLSSALKPATWPSRFCLNLTSEQTRAPLTIGSHVSWESPRAAPSRTLLTVSTRPRPCISRESNSNWAKTHGTTTCSMIHRSSSTWSVTEIPWASWTRFYWPSSLSILSKQRPSVSTVPRAKTWSTISSSSPKLLAARVLELSRRTRMTFCTQTTKRRSNQGKVNLPAKTH